MSWIVAFNFSSWNNGCGTCIAEMLELEELYQEWKGQNINLIGVGTASGENEETLSTVQKLLPEKGLTYINISLNPENVSAM